jgi:ABC-type uncharacterized transport system substrate-binding protein
MNRRYSGLLAAALGFILPLIGSGCGHSPRRILYINSYQEGYAPSDEKMLAVQQAVAAQPNIVLKIFFLDAQRRRDEKSFQSKVDEALRTVDDFKPDVIIAADDDAVKYVVAPRFRKGRIPVVFCGVDWTCQQYGLPTAQVTGILETPPVRETVQALRQSDPAIRTCFVLSGNSVSDRKNVKTLETILREEGLQSETLLVNSFEEWKRHFEAANNSADAVFLPSIGGIDGWDDTQAYEFVFRAVRKPVFTCERSMMRYAVFGFTMVESEQGQWAVKTALAILDGKSPVDFPVAVNRETRGYVNPVLADKIGFRFDPQTLARLEPVK